MRPKLVMGFHILPAVVFRCPECDGWIRIERSLPDTDSSGRYCGCGATYRVIWGETEETTRVEMIRGKLT
jgi:hypothetical protein